jgi:hypothetical protein
MTHFARLRPRLTRLSVSFICLGFICAAVSFFSVYELSDWQFYTLWITAGVAAFFSWLLPSLAFAARFVDVTSKGIFISRGLGSKNRRELSWDEIASISYSPVRGILITGRDDSEHYVRGLPAQKATAAELQALLRRK